MNFQEENTNKTKPNSLLLISGLVFLLLCWILFFVYKDTILWKFKQEEIKVVVVDKSKDTTKEKKENKNQKWEQNDNEIKLSLKEKNITEEVVSDSNKEYLSLKVSSLFPFYELGEIKETTMEELLKIKFFQYKDFIQSFENLPKDDELRKVKIYSFEFNIKELTLEDMIKKGLVEWENGKNAILILFQLYQKIRNTKLDIDINSVEGQKRFLTFFTKKVYQDDKFLQSMNEELSKIATYFNQYLILLNRNNGVETLKEYLAQQRIYLEKLIPIEKLVYFDNFIEYNWTNTEWETWMVEMIIKQLQWKKEKEAKDLIKRLRFYDEYLKVVLNKNENKT